ncbi:hypothetical protein AWB78_08352 [Caballeronia calidae]|uniref:Uncharacterized protein n=2 Tax=Caballeronia calidae TaxID=1777139 RepID=A0A158EJJ5_9BURK|nr:hypothetical protein AWB78_08352 [Caballeronia calidae]
MNDSFYATDYLVAGVVVGILAGAAGVPLVATLLDRLPGVYTINAWQILALSFALLAILLLFKPLLSLIFDLCSTPRLGKEFIIASLVGRLIGISLGLLLGISLTGMT